MHIVPVREEWWKELEEKYAKATRVNNIQLFHQSYKHTAPFHQRKTINKSKHSIPYTNTYLKSTCCASNLGGGGKCEEGPRSCNEEQKIAVGEI